MPRYQFQAQPDASYSFEDFLLDAERTGIRDPGEAMLTVLERVRVPGLNPARIRGDSRLNPCGRPEQLLPFLRYICEEGQWGVNLEIRID
jgi:hypothetical protein